MLSELAETEAEGAISDIYHEIRRLWGVAYVSSLQRHLATKPGWLEWSWSSLSPAFISGQAQRAGWQSAKNTGWPFGNALSTKMLKSLNLRSEDAHYLTEICGVFVRVAPVNLVFAGLIGKLLSGEQSSGEGWADDGWSPPISNVLLPKMANFEHLEANTKHLLLKFGMELNGTVFVPGLYRMMAPWPALLEYIYETLSFARKTSEITQAQTRFLSRIDSSVETLFARLPRMTSTLLLDVERDAPSVLSSIKMYRTTSPDMVAYGLLIASMLTDKADRLL